MGRLEGKSVIITGAGSGIGRAASLLFTKEGARLIAVDRTEGVKETVEAGQRRPAAPSEAVMADAGSEKRRHRLHRQGGVEIRQARCDLGQCRRQRRAGAACRADRGTLAGSPAHQSDRTVPRDQAFDAAHDQAEVRLDRLHRLGRGPEGRRQRTSLCREQGRRHQPGADHGLFAVRHRRAHQCGLPRPDRDRHDQAGVRPRQGARHRRTRSASSIR